MPSGILGQGSPSANTDTTIYTVPAGLVAAVTIIAVNRSITEAKLRVALATTGTPGVAEYIEWDAVVPAHGGTYERTAPIMNAGRRVVVRDDQGTVSYTVSGFEQGA